MKISTVKRPMLLILWGYSVGFLFIVRCKIFIAVLSQEYIRKDNNGGERIKGKGYIGVGLGVSIKGKGV